MMISRKHFLRSPVAEMLFDNKKYDWKMNFINLILLPDLKNIHQLLILLSAEHHIQIPTPPKHYTRQQNR